MAGLAVSAALACVLLTGAVSTTLPEPPPMRRIMAGTGVAAQARAAPAGWDRGWEVQVGTFSERARAEEHLRLLATRLPDVVGLPMFAEPLGPFTRARIAGLPDETAARRACSEIAAHGSDCFVVSPGL